MYRYSQRLSWPIRQNDLALQRDARREHNLPTNDLTRSNPTEAFTEYPHAAIADALRKIGSFRYAPDPCGLLQVRSAIQTYYAVRHINVELHDIVVTASTSEAYAYLFKLLCDPGDEVLVPTPSYPLFEYLGGLESVRVVNYLLHFDGNWFIDFDHLQRQINSKTRAIIIVNPNNPTGSFLKRHELDELLHIAAERGLPVISDEVFLDYGLSEDLQRVQTLVGHPHVLSFSLNGLSKSAGMPQMKLGWIAINGPAAEKSKAQEKLSLIADTYLSVSTPVQAAAPRLFEIGANIQEMILMRIRRNWTTLKSTLAESPAKALTCEGGWSAIIRLPATQPEDAWVSTLLNVCGVRVDPGWFFDMNFEPYVVVSLISAPELFEEGILRLQHTVNRDEWKH